MRETSGKIVVVGVCSIIMLFCQSARVAQAVINNPSEETSWLTREQFEEKDAAASNVEKMNVIADVGFRTPILLKQENNKLDLYFRLGNNLAKSEAGIRYGVQLIRDNLLVAEKVYTDDVLSIEGNNSIQKIFNYDAPVFLSGDFELLLVAKNESGLPLSTFKFEKPLTLNGVGEYLEINNKSCNLKIEGDAEGKSYLLMQGVSLKSEETLRLNCEVISHFKEAVTISPSYNTFERTLFGNPVDKDRKSIEVSLKAGEKKTINLKVEKPKAAQAYEVKLDFLKAGLAVASPVVFHYVIAGESATIQKMDLDKVSYQKGDTINATLMWSGSADNFDGSRTGSTTDSPILLSLDISNEFNEKCADQLGKALKLNSPEAKFALTAKADCVNPKVKVVLKNGQGVILAQKEFNYLKDKKVSPQQPIVTKSKNLNLIIATGLIFAFFIGLILFFLKKKKRRHHVFLLLIILASFCFGFQRVEAVTMFANGAGWGTSTATVEFNGGKTVYNPEESMKIIVSSSSWWYECANAGPWTSLSITGPSQCSAQLISKGQSAQDFGVGSKTCAAESAPGSHDVSLVNEVFGECFYYGGCDESYDGSECGTKYPWNQACPTTGYRGKTCVFQVMSASGPSGLCENGRNYAKAAGSLSYTVNDTTPDPSCNINFSSGSYSSGDWGTMTWSAANATNAYLICSLSGNTLVNSEVYLSTSVYDAKNFGVPLASAGTVNCVLSVVNGSKTGTCSASAIVTTPCTASCSGDAGCLSTQPAYTDTVKTASTKCCDGKSCYYCWTGNWNGSRCVNFPCNSPCSSDDQCISGLKCIATATDGSRCRLETNSTSATCAGAPACSDTCSTTGVDARACIGTLSDSVQSGSNLKVINNVNCCNSAKTCYACADGYSWAGGIVGSTCIANTKSSCDAHFDPASVIVNGTSKLYFNLIGGDKIMGKCTGMTSAIDITGASPIPFNSLTSAGTANCDFTTFNGSEQGTGCSAELVVSAALSCGTIPAGVTPCPDTDINLTSSASWHYIGKTLATCNIANKCEYYTPSLPSCGESCDYFSGEVCAGTLTCGLPGNCGIPCGASGDNTYNPCSCPAASYSCTTTSGAPISTPPVSGATMCPNDNAGLTSDLVWNSIGTTAAGCTDTRKCEYFIPCNPGSVCIPDPLDCSDGYCGVKKKHCMQTDPNCAYATECTSAKIAACEAQSIQCNCNNGAWNEIAP